MPPGRWASTTCILKPWDADELVAVVRRLLVRSRELRERTAASIAMTERLCDQAAETWTEIRAAYAQGQEQRKSAETDGPSLLSFPSPPSADDSTSARAREHHDHATVSQRDRQRELRAMRSKVWMPKGGASEEKAAV